MKTPKRKRLGRLVAVLLTLSLVAAACGDDDEAAPVATTAAPTTTAAATTTTAAQNPLTVAALSAAGDVVELPQVKAGYLQWIYADEAGKRIEDAAEDAIRFLGWEFVTCDAAGDPAQMPICGNQLLDQDVDVIFTDGIPEAFVTDVLEQAEAAGIPVISGGGEVEPRDFYVASYASDDTDLGTKLAEYLKSQLPDGGNLLVQTFPSAWSAKRQNGLAAAIEGTNITIVNTWEVDPTNMVPGTEADVTTKLAQFDVDAIWVDFSVASIGAANAIGALFPDGDDPDRPLLLTFYANPLTVDDIRAGRLDAAVDEKLEWQSWAGADAIAQLLARGTVPSSERAPDFGGLNFSSRQIVTIDNIPATGTDIEAPPPGDYAEFFRTKWCAEFSNLENC